MKKFLSLLWAGFVGSMVLHAAPQSTYLNYGQVTTPANIDAVSFENFGIFRFTNNTVNTNLGTTNASILTQVFPPFDTKDTLNFINTGLIEIAPGFRFDTGTAANRHSAATFTNSGTILGLDSPASIFTLDDSLALPTYQPSQILVFATNIVNEGGVIETGTGGLLQLIGSNVDLSTGGLAAGTVDEADTNDLLGHEVFTGGYFSIFNYEYVNPPGVYDLFWGVDTFLETSLSNSQNGYYTITFLNDFTDFLPFTTRDQNTGSGVILGANTTAFTSNSFPGLSSFAYSSAPTQISNFFFSEVNVVLVNTNLGDTNLSVQVGFNNITASNGLFFYGDSAVDSLVKISETVPDVVSGNVVTNAVYAIDRGANVFGFGIQTDAAGVDGFGRPYSFEIATSQPPEWTNAQAANLPGFDPSTGGQFGIFDDSIYRAQVGRNPERLDGAFPDLQTNFVDVSLLDVIDPTNEPGRLEITSSRLNLNNARLRSDGLATMIATNLTGSPLYKDWGNINSDLNNTNGLMTVSNLFPSNFQRVRGIITMYSFDSIGSNIVGNVTNLVEFHLTFVEPDLRGSFQSSIRNLALRATNTTSIQDSLRVIGSTLISASNLNINNRIALTQNASSLYPANTPNLKHLFLDTNAVLVSDNIIDVGFNTGVGHSSPVKRKYTVPSMTNLGILAAVAPVLQASNFECDGSIIASNSGSMIIEAANLSLGTSSTNGATNYLIADQNVTLSANTIEFTNSQIIAGGTNSQQKGALLLETTPTGMITDFASSGPSTNTYSTNQWLVTAGFSLPVKPAAGDLFGTKITTVVSNFTVALHTWAGADLGATSDGFVDNVVIGHLVLSRQSPNSVLHFTGAGAQNGMYVDYLELDPNSLSFSDYRNGLVIDSNLTIYFASCNVDPTKLEAIYTNRLIWVPRFTGPNSTVAVPIFNSTNTCNVNANVYNSSTISSSGTVVNSDNQPYILHDPVTGTNADCDSDISEFREFTVSGEGTNRIMLDVAINGQGSVTPELKANKIAYGKRYALTATPAVGWVFSSWTIQGLPTDVDASGRTLKFTLTTNVTLTANFSPRAFTLVQGTYHGLILNTNESVSSSNSGSFTFTLGANGSASGRLQLGATLYAFTAKFGTDGSASTTAKHGKDTLALVLNVDMSGKTGEVTGYAGTVANQLQGDLQPIYIGTDVSPYVGRYTLVLTNTATNGARDGYSYATVSVSKRGILSLSGKLSDGTAFSQTVPVSKEGYWPFYAYAAPGSDMLIGWVSFQADTVRGPSIHDTNVLWSKAASSKSRYFSTGFTNAFRMLTSPYSNPGHSATGLTLYDPIVVVSQEHAASSTNTVTSNGKTSYSTNNLTLSINPAVGTFSGLIKNTGTGPSAKMSGVVLQNQDSAYGFILGANPESDAVILQSR